MSEEVDPINDAKRLTVEVSSGDKRKVELDADLWNKLQREAEENGRGVGEEMRVALEQILNE